MIEVKFDNNLNLPPIEEIMHDMAPDESGSMGQNTSQQQTKTTGILAPLVKLNDVTINFSQVKRMTLSNNHLPEVSLVVADPYGLIQTIDQPTNDNFLQIQIIPPFENAYKKINLTFYMDAIQMLSDGIHIHGIYNIPHLYDTVIKSFGKISTYKFFESVAHDLQLGFCSNLSDTQDSRYIYIPNKQYTDVLDEEIIYGGSQTQILDYWVDLWNNLNLVDIYKQYTTVEEGDSMMIWSLDSRFIGTEPDSENAPSRMMALLTNNPNFTTNQLFIRDYKYSTSSTMSTDRVFEIYDMNALQNDSRLIQDGDIHKDIFVSYEYGGELFGDHNYLLQKACRKLYIDKIDGQTIKTHINYPTLSLMKGHKVNLYWYDLNNWTKDVKDAVEITSNITLPKDDVIEGEDQYKINKQVSGQYYIIDTNIEFVRKGNLLQWRQNFTLGRPLKDIQNYNTHDGRSDSEK